MSAIHSSYRIQKLCKSTRQGNLYYHTCLHTIFLQGVHNLCTFINRFNTYILLSYILPNILHFNRSIFPQFYKCTTKRSKRSEISSITGKGYKSNYNHTIWVAGPLMRSVSHELDSLRNNRALINSQPLIVLQWLRWSSHERPTLCHFIK